MSELSTPNTDWNILLNQRLRLLREISNSVGLLHPEFEVTDEMIVAFGLNSENPKGHANELITCIIGAADMAGGDVTDEEKEAALYALGVRTNSASPRDRRVAYLQRSKPGTPEEFVDRSWTLDDMVLVPEKEAKGLVAIASMMMVDDSIWMYERPVR